MVKSTTNNGDKTRDYYFILNVTHTASASEVRRAYRRLALECHPDHHPENPESEEKFKLINEAYSILGDVQRRKEYDSFQQLHSPLSDNFSSGMGRGYRKSGRGNRCGRQQCGIVQERTFNVVQLGQIYEIFLTPVEARLGTERFVVTTMEQKQHGYRIRIPSGINNGTHFKAILGRDDNRYIFVRVTIR